MKISAQKSPKPSSGPYAVGAGDGQINLMHLELFHHFEKEVVGSLSFPQIWPGLIRRSFHVSQPLFPINMHHP